MSEAQPSHVAVIVVMRVEGDPDPLAVASTKCSVCDHDVWLTQTNYQAMQLDNLLIPLCTFCALQFIPPGTKPFGHCNESTRCSRCGHFHPEGNPGNFHDV